MSQAATQKTFTKRDLAICLFGMVLIWSIVQFWLPAAPLEDSLARRAHVVAGIGMMALSFLALSIYGIWRFSPDRGRVLVLGLVALPAVYGGALLGGLPSRLADPSLLELSGAMRAQDGLAALWWGRQAALDLPAWSRGGHELWPTLAGELLVSTHADRVQVELLPSSASPRQCERMLSELSSQKSVLSSMGSLVVVNGRPWNSSTKASEACEKGGMLSLVAKLPNED